METELIKYIEREFHAKYYDITALDFSKNRKALKYINGVITKLSKPIFFFVKPDLGASMRSMEMEDVCHFILMRGGGTQHIKRINRNCS